RRGVVVLRGSQDTSGERERQGEHEHHREQDEAHPGDGVPATLHPGSLRGGPERRAGCGCRGQAAGCVPGGCSCHRLGRCAARTDDEETLMPDQPVARYAYLGPEGTFTEAALRAFVGPDPVQARPATDVVAALDAVRAGRVDFAVVPMENSVEGGVNATMDTLGTSAEPLVIVGEVVVPVAFVL